MKLYTFNMDPYHSGSVFAGNIPKCQDVYLKIRVYKNGKPSVDVVEKDDVFYPEFAVYAKSEQENKMTVYRVPNSTNEDDLIDLDIYSQSYAQSMFEDGSKTEEDVSGERWIVLKLTYDNFKKFEKDSESKFFIPVLGPEKTEGQTVKSRLTWIKVALTAGRVGIPEINDGGGGGEIPTDPTFSSIKVGNPKNPNFEVDRSGNLTAGTGEFENDLLVGGQQVATVNQIKSPYYQFDTTADLSNAVFDPNTVYVVETGTTTPATWNISLNVTQTGYPNNAVMDCVLLVEDLTQIPTSIMVGISNGAVPRFFGDTFDAIDTTNVPYIITFTVLNWDAYAANVFVKIQKQES